MKKYIIHAVGWLVYFTFLYVLINIYTDSATALIKTSSIGGVQFVIFYINLYLTTRKLKHQRKMLYFISLNIFLLIFGMLLNSYLSELTPMENEYGNYFMYVEEQLTNDGLTYFDKIDLLDKKYGDYFEIEDTFIHGFPILLVQFLSFLVYTHTRRKKEEQKELALVKAEKLFLKQQMNPHFLLNVLNNIYSLSIDNDPKTSEAIMQLSNLLSYSLYGEKNGTVSIGEEIKNITSFIDLFKLKDDDLGKIEFINKDVNKTLRISPMLLLPFVENALKHGNIESNFGFIKIELQSKNNELTFSCRNSFKSIKSVDKNGGIGIENIKRSLELTYPKHHLTINKTEQDYQVELKLNLNED